jgi:ABC-type dipeptide/oligopeptide/nickel transport system ATPase component
MVEREQEGPSKNQTKENLTRKNNFDVKSFRRKNVYTKYKMDAQISLLQQQNEKLLSTIETLKKQLEKYTNNERHKKYYEKNKERVKENAKNYLNRLKDENPEKLKEYRHRAYLKRKEKQGDTE